MELWQVALTVGVGVWVSTRLYDFAYWWTVCRERNTVNQEISERTSSAVIREKLAAARAHRANEMYVRFRMDSECVDWDPSALSEPPSDGDSEGQYGDLR